MIIVTRSGPSVMSKEDDGSCKLTSVYKHKERKPKKPHYIPRPWGKPYNYKCFQCPFTCMEKSHLYNHMKYSLCKNSLSLLIESDWPYKKGNFLHPELHLIHAAETSRHPESQMDNQETCDSTAIIAETRDTIHVSHGDMVDNEKSGVDVLSSKQMHMELHKFQEIEDDNVGTAGQLKETDPREKKGGAMRANYHPTDPEDPNVKTLLLGLKNKGDKFCKDTEPDFIITDVYSLQKNVMKGKEPLHTESEVKPKNCKVPKKCLGSNGILMEQWKLFTNRQRRSRADAASPCAKTNIIPCYPPPSYSDYQETQRLNLSLLGINYPLNPNLFPYFGPTVTNSATPQPHLTQIPFLASTAQLMHPHSANLQALQNPERPAFLPRFYYPLLFEHMFGSSEDKTAAGKLNMQQQQPGTSVPNSPNDKSPSEPQKGALQKVPVVQADTLWATSLQGKPSLENLQAAPTEAEEEKWPNYDNVITANLGINNQSRDSLSDMLKDSFKESSRLSNIRKAESPKATCLSNSESLTNSLKRKSLFGGELNLLKDHIASKSLTATKISDCTRSLQDIPQLLKSFDQWKQECKSHPRPETQEKAICSECPSSVITTNGQWAYKQNQVHRISKDSETTTMLNSDLSKTLEEYQEVEKKLSDMAKENNSEQKEMKDQLFKIRKELYHIHQMLANATIPHEVPLDLSVKRSQGGFEKGYQTRNEASKSVHEDPRLQCKDHDSNTRSNVAGETVNGDKMSNYLPEPKTTTFDLLMKTTQSEEQQPSLMVHHSTMRGHPSAFFSVPLELHRVMEPYYRHTTKCEADSSVLLSTDGKSSNSTQSHQQLPPPEEEQMNYRDRHHSISYEGSSPSESETICLHNPLNTD
ncbi:proline-rich protein 35 [Microcaecilia unicolor]|uniref:Proline-rich protein 35 n=1 Tax=Microcaecilia unicolor TaxID=1415580 RepID=A0A6P7Z0R4_9AMPH|nr:proline-rich protein 35 [Microcaecilia unicolor]XP_030069081.1 proline-rich protein 35 [Microcaecilia unicolor]